MHDFSCFFTCENQLCEIIVVNMMYSMSSIVGSLSDI